MLCIVCTVRKAFNFVVYCLYYVYNVFNFRPTTVESIVGAVRSEKTGRPQRQAAKRVPNLFLNDSDDDVAEPLYDSDHEKDQEFTEQDAMREAGPSTDDDDDGDDNDNVGGRKPRKQGVKKTLQYDPPSSLAPVLSEFRERRHEAMKEAFVDNSYEAEVTWRPNAEDTEEIERVILSRYT